MESKIVCLGIATLILSACGDRETAPVPEPSEDSDPNSVVYVPCITDADIDTRTYGSSGDPLLGYQWYLEAAAANVRAAWTTGATGSNIEIAVIDDSVQINHEDLAANFITNGSINVAVPAGHAQQYNPVSNDCADPNAPHGTAAAGIIGAVGDNRRGIKGISHRASLWGANLILGGSLTTEKLMRVFGEHRVERTAVSSNSWGSSAPTVLDNTLASEFYGFIENGLSAGFDRKGISYVFAAGNHRHPLNASGQPVDADGEGRDAVDRASYSGLLNHRGIIAVCAVASDKRFSDYSEPGPNLWLCGYSDSGGRVTDTSSNLAAEYTSASNALGLPTTDLSGEHGYNRPANTVRCPETIGGNDLISGAQFNFDSPMLEHWTSCDDNTRRAGEVDEPIEGFPVNGAATNSYHRYFTGTSAAAPVVSGVIGLMRSTNRALTWRDVKLILAESADFPAGVTSITTGTATYNTGDGFANYSYHEDYGFGIVDAAAAVRLARSWTPISATGITWTSNAASAGNNKVFPRDGESSSSGTINFIEYVELEITGPQQDNFGDLRITLTSPHGTTVTFAEPHKCVAANPAAQGGGFRLADNDGACGPAFANAFTFGAAAFLGENPAAANGGRWTLTATNNGNAVTLNHNLRIYGHNNQ